MPWSPPRGQDGAVLWNDDFGNDTLRPQYVISNSAGTVVDTNSGAGILRIKTTGTALGSYLDYGRAFIYLPGALNFDIYYETTFNTTLEQYSDSCFRSDSTINTGGLTIGKNCYNLELACATAGLSLLRWDADVSTTQATDASFGAPGQFVVQGCRVVCYQEYIYCKAWQRDLGEPQAWNIVTTNRNHYLSQGREWFGLGVIGGAAQGPDAQFEIQKISRLNLGRIWSQRRRYFVSSAASANLGTATVSVDGNNLIFNALTLGTSTVPIVAYAPSSTRSLPNALATLIANGFTYSDLLAVGTGTVGLTGNPLSSTRSLPTTTVALTASAISEALSLTAATVGINANGLSYADSISTGTITVPVIASALTTSGYALAQAAITILANNLASTGQFNLGTTTVPITGYNLGTTVTSQANLGTGNVSVNGGNLAVALSTGLAGSVAISGAPLGSSRSTGLGAVSVTALPLAQARSAVLGLASVLFTAYNLSNPTSGFANLGSASVPITAFPLSSLLLLSTGIVPITALPITYVDSPSSGTTSVGTQASPLSSTRQLGQRDIALTAFALTYTHSNVMAPASVAITAYDLSADIGTTRGVVRTKPPLISNRGGRVLTSIGTSHAITGITTTEGA